MACTLPSITPSGATFAQFQAGGARGQLERLIAANYAANSAPSVPTAMLTQLCSEMGGPIDANPGHFENVITGAGGKRTVRKWD
jgi:hypothetical protein